MPLRDLFELATTELYYTTPIKLTQQKCYLFDASNNFDIYLATWFCFVLFVPLLLSWSNKMKQRRDTIASTVLATMVKLNGRMAIERKFNSIVWCQHCFGTKWYSIVREFYRFRWYHAICINLVKIRNNNKIIDFPVALWHELATISSCTALSNTTILICVWAEFRKSSKMTKFSFHLFIVIIVIVVEKMYHSER